MRAHTFAVVLTLAAAAACIARVDAATPASPAQTWLVASDLHLNPFDRRAHPSLVGSDTNVALFRSALAEMKRRVPDPAVVLLPGDFFAHDFAGRARRNGGVAERAAVATMRFVAAAFGRAYPHARFAVALGNNDAPCGDYHSALGTRYASDIARVWAPLIARDGANSDFARSFAASGSYIASLPLPRTRLIVFDDVPLSALYMGNCAGIGDPTSRAIAWLREALATTPSGTNNIVMMHAPPGYDPFSTEKSRGFFPLPFLGSDGNGAVVQALADPASRVTFAVAGHAHRFDFRLAGDVPVIVFGSLSPVYHSNPAFYALDVNADGTARDVRTFAFDEWTQAWQPARSFDDKWRGKAIDASSLRAVHARLERNAEMRRAWDAASSGWPSNWHIAWGVWGARWRIPWCAQVFLDGGFTACAGLDARAAMLRAGLALLAACAGVLIVVVITLSTARKRAQD
jgi:hypothetical protein